MKMFDIMKFGNVFKVNENGTVCVYIVNQFGKKKKVKIDGIKDIKIEDGSVLINGSNGNKEFKFEETGIYESIKRYLGIVDKKEEEQAEDTEEKDIEKIFEENAAKILEASKGKYTSYKTYTDENGTVKCKVEILKIKVKKG